MSSRALRLAQIYLMSADGSDVLRLSENGPCFGPTWSPDGQSIAFLQRGQREDGAFLSGVGLVTVDTAEHVALTPAEPLPAGVDPYRAASDGPSWSPSGERLAYASQREAHHWRVWLTTRAGGPGRLLLPELADAHYAPSWSRQDATKLAYVADAGGIQDVWLVNVDDPARRENLTQGKVLRPEGLRWSPDGSRLAFAAEDPRPVAEGGGDFEIYLLELASRGLTQVTDNTTIDIDPAWSSDGQRLVIASNRASLAQGGPATASSTRDLWFVTPGDPALDSNLTPLGTGTDEQPDWYWGPPCGEP